MISKSSRLSSAMRVAWSNTAKIAARTICFSSPLYTSKHALHSYIAPTIKQSINTTFVPSRAFSESNPVRLGPNLNKYGVNLNKMVLEGKIDPVIGREAELDRAIQILSRRTKNNPCFIGEPGVGKTALAEGIAHRICNGKVPHWMSDSIIVSLDMALMLAGTKFRGEFEERLKGVLKDIEGTGDRIILFIDEIHVITSSGGESIDAGNIMKPALARGQIRCMGATTIDEFKKHIEKDAALARRFQSILIPEPSIDETTRILIGLKEKYELYHGLLISDEAIKAAASLSAKYITDRKLPDKAVDLIDEACSRLRIQLESAPGEIKALDEELEAMSSRTDVNSDDLANLKLKRDSLDEKWTKYRDGLRELNKEKNHIAQLKLDQFVCKRLGNHDRSKYINEIELPEKISQLRESEQRFQSTMDSYFATRPMITDDTDSAVNSDASDSKNNSTSNSSASTSPQHMLQPLNIAEVVRNMTGIPLGSLMERERRSLLTMEAEMCKRVVGQAEAISAICRCIRLSRAGLKFHDRPLGVFLMLGGTGVGKTEVAKALCQYLFHNDHAILRVDMSEYMERFSVSRLIGAPPGYVGYDEGGTLTESVRTRPYQVILLDEFEKAHRDVSNLLLQVFDEGRLSDSKGKLVDFRNTVIIMTSNLLTADNIPKNEDGSNNNELIRQMVSAHFLPEFVNRLDEIVVFNNLTEEVLTSITDIQLKRVSDLLKARGIGIQVSDDVKKWLAATGCDGRYGARPLKRLIQSEVLDPLATTLLEDTLKNGDTITVTRTEEPVDQSKFVLLKHGSHTSFWKSNSEA